MMKLIVFFSVVLSMSTGAVISIFSFDSFDPVMKRNNCPKPPFMPSALMGVVATVSAG